MLASAEIVNVVKKMMRIVFMILIITLMKVTLHS